MASPAQAPRFNNPNQASSPWARGASHDVYHYPSTGQPMPPIQPQYNVAPQPTAYTNNYQPVAYGPTPDQQQSFNNAPVASENKRRKQLLIGAGVLTAATATIATAGSLFLGLRSTGADEKSDVPRFETATSHSQDAAELSSELFKNISRAEQLDYVGPILTQDAQSTVEEMRSYLSNEGRSDILSDGYGGTRTIEAPSVDNTPQEIWDQLTVASYQAWSEADKGNFDLAEKLAAGFAHVGSREYNDLVKRFGDETPVINAGAAIDAKPVIQEGSYDDVVSNGLGLIEFEKVSSFNDNDKVKVIAQFEQGSQPDSGRWILLKTIKTHY